MKFQIWRQNFQICRSNQKLKLTRRWPVYYSLSLYILGIYALRVTPRYQTQQGKWSLTTPGYAGSAGLTI